MANTQRRLAALLLLAALLAACAAGVPSDPSQPPSAVGAGASGNGPDTTEQETAGDAATEPGASAEAEQGPAAPPAGGPSGDLPSADLPAQADGPAPADTPPAPLPDLPEGEPSRLVVHGDRSCAMVALTYDAGSGADGAEAILDVLRKHGVTATFFLTGRWAEQFPDLARRIADEGHEVGNHTYSHPDLTTLPDEEVLQQIADGEEAIRLATGLDPRPLFREPYGAFSDHERRLVRQAGYSYSIYWEVDTLDWTFPGVEATTERILRAQAGSIVLMHLNVADSAAASDAAIGELRARGYEIVPVSRLLQCTTEAEAAQPETGGN